MSKLRHLKYTLGMGARTNKYDINIASPLGDTGDMFNTLAKSVNLPGKSFADIEVHIQGKLITVAGDTQYDGTLSITFMDTEEHKVRTAIIDWMNFIDDTTSNSRGATDHSSYMSHCIIRQLNDRLNTDGSRQATASYRINNIYPKSISEIQYSNETSGILEFTVDFNFSSWEKI